MDRYEQAKLLVAIADLIDVIKHETTNGSHACKLTTIAMQLHRIAADLIKREVSDGAGA